MSSSEHSGVPEDSKSPLFQVLGFTPTLDQVRVATTTTTTTPNYNLQTPHTPSSQEEFICKQNKKATV
jgi:hypothetical protein